MRSQGHGWNHKRVLRVYCNIKLNLSHRARKRVLIRDPTPLQAVQALNKVWSLDFMCDTLCDSRPFRTFNIIDEDNREGLYIEWGSSISSLRLARVMQELGEVYDKPNQNAFIEQLNRSFRIEVLDACRFHSVRAWC